MFVEISDLNSTISWVLREPWSSCADPEVSFTACDRTMKAFHVLLMLLNVFTLQYKGWEKFWWKKVFIEISDPNLAFFRDLWRIFKPSGLFPCAYYWLKYSFRSFPQSLDDAKHVRIDLMNIKIFFRKKSFRRNFRPKIDLSHGMNMRMNMRQSHHLPTLSVKKIFLRP